MDPDALRARRRAIGRSVARTVLLLVVVTAVFSLVPVQALTLGGTILISAVFGIGLIGIASLIVWQVTAYQDASMSGQAVSRACWLRSTLLCCSSPSATTCWRVADPEEIVGLKTRTDALYFSLTIVSTVGFGDVHAEGQAARAIVTLQLAFNLLFVSLAVAAARAAGPPAVGPPNGKTGAA